MLSPLIVFGFFFLPSQYPKSYTQKWVGETDWDGRVGRRPWAHLLPQGHQNYSYLWDDYLWERPEAQRKTFSTTEDRRSLHETSRKDGGNLVWSGPPWASDPQTGGISQPQKPSLRSEGVSISHQAPQPKGPPLWRWAPRRLGLETSGACCSTELEGYREQTLLLKVMHKISHALSPSSVAVLWQSR